MALTRDSLLLYLGLGLAVLTYVVTAEKDITGWNVRDWAQLGIVGLTYLMGRLQTSPLPHSDYGAAKITPDDVR